MLYCDFMYQVKAKYKKKNVDVQGSFIKFSFL